VQNLLNEKEKEQKEEDKEEKSNVRESEKYKSVG
jgi:hypothetical protein